MDVLVHGIHGALVGANLGHPIIGTVAGVLPDLVLGIKRKVAPTDLYNLTHSNLGLLALMGLAGLIGGLSIALTVGGAIWLHLWIDTYTHGKDWAPPLGFPFSDFRHSHGEEWEYFNKSFWNGLVLSVGVVACLVTFLALK